MELRISNYIVISTVNYTDGKSDNDGGKKEWKMFISMENFPVSQHDMFPRLEGNQWKI